MCVDCVKSAALLAMAARAEEFDVQGVAWVLISEPSEDGAPTIWSPSAMPVGRFYREADPDDKGEGDTGVNYFNVAAGKLGEQLETAVPCGTSDRPPRMGEFGFMGGAVYILEDGTELHATFSGGSQDEDVVIAEVGMEQLRYGMLRLQAYREFTEKIGYAIEDLEAFLNG